MDFAKSLGPSVLPPIPPTPALGEASREFSLESETLSSGERTTLYWALRLMQAPESQALAARIPGGNRLAFGFLDPEFEQNNFGVIVLAASGAESPVRGESELLSPIVVDGHPFPAVVRRIVEQRQLAPPTVTFPKIGSSAAWARSRITSTAPIGPGVLTAKHVTTHWLGTVCTLSCGCVGTVDDVAPECIDAALVRLPAQCPHNPPPGAQWRKRRLVAPAAAVHLHAPSGIVRTTITATTNLLNLTTAPELPIRVLLANHGVPGDSGSLIEETRTGLAVGLYMGKYTAPRAGSLGQTGGLAQHIGQVCELMQMELYK